VNYLRIKNWEEFQHYKDRNPPWIKLHRTLLDDYEFSCLQDASKAHLMLIWLFASQCEGRIPDDPKFLQKKLGLSSVPDLKTFIDHGFLIPEQSASTTLAPAASKLRLETYKEETYKEETYKPPEWIDRGVWDSWVLIRPAKARTPASLKAAVEKLDGFRTAGFDPNEAISNSLANGWQGLFEPKAKTAATQSLSAFMDERDKRAAN
jgi:hypothetical protein